MKHRHCDVRAFTHLARAWYAETHPRLGLADRVVDEVMFGWYVPDGGARAQMAMRWYQLGNGPPTPRLEVFCDAWHALATFGDVIAALAPHDDHDITPEEFCAILVACGFEDWTEEEGA